MTNGEKIKEIFPYLESDETDLAKVLNIDNLKGWWNAEYKEPITENCIACKYDETEEKDGEHCKKCLAGDSQFELDKEFVGQTTKNDLGVDDCVSRILVQSAISKSIEHKENPYQLSKRIDRLPTVIPQESVRQKGKWISYHFGAYYECSNCHERNNSRYDKYCKFCGADMREAEKCED